MSREPYPSETADRFQVRMPDGLRDRIADAAKANNRSMNSEIVARLALTFERLGDYNVIGADALSKRLEANVEASERLTVELLYAVRASGGGIGEEDDQISKGVNAWAKIHGVTKAAAAQEMLKQFLQTHGLWPASRSSGDKP